METEKLLAFLDQLIESAYQARVFAKEGVQLAINTNELIKRKIVEADTLGNQNTELKVQNEILESENERLKKRLAFLDNALDDTNQETDPSEIEVVETLEKPKKEKPEKNSNHI